MTLYYSGEDDDRNDESWSPAEHGKRQIIDNHAEYARITDDGELILNIDEIGRDEKIKTLVDVAISAVEDSETYTVAQYPEIEYNTDQ